MNRTEEMVYELVDEIYSFPVPLGTLMPRIVKECGSVITEDLVRATLSDQESDFRLVGNMVFHIDDVEDDEQGAQPEEEVLLATIIFP
jgi:hypothetical protein